MINRVLLDDASKKPGSVSNPILIDIDIHGTSGGQDTSEQDDSDGDTVRLSTPDFYEILRDGGTTGSQKKSALTNSPPVVIPSQLYGQTFDFTCSLKPKLTACAHHEGKRPELTGASEEASKGKNECATLTLESHIASRGQAGVSGPGQGGELKPSINTSHIANDNPPPPCLQGSICPKRKLEGMADLGVRRSKRLMREKS